MADVSLSDKGLSIFVFAAYHQLTSGEPVSEVVTRDASGHKADAEGLRELESAGLASLKDDRAAFSDAGVAFLKTVVDAVRATAGTAQSGRAVA